MTAATIPRACLFQEDNDGQGAEIAEIHFSNGRFETRYAFLNEETVRSLIAEGVVEVFLMYRGSLRLDRCFRDEFPTYTADSYSHT